MNMNMSTTTINYNNVKFKHPFTAILAGPSQAGKTEFIIRLLENVNDMITPAPNKIIYCYSFWQENEGDHPTHSI